MKIGDNTTYEIECHRGEIRYMMKGETTGSEQSGGRPVIIVSNEQCNKCSPVITVVPITSQEKTPLPTHFKLSKNKYPVYGTVLCEQIQSCSKLRLGQFVGDIDEHDMQQIEERLKIQPELKTTNTEPIVATVIKTDDMTLDAAKAEIEDLKTQLLKTQQRESFFRELYYEEFMRKS